MTPCPICVRSVSDSDTDRTHRVRSVSDSDTDRTQIGQGVIFSMKSSFLFWNSKICFPKIEKIFPNFENMFEKMWRSVANSWPIRLWIGHGIIVSTKNDAWGPIYRGPRAPVVQGSKGPQGPQGSKGAWGPIYRGPKVHKGPRAPGVQGSKGL